MNAAQYCVYTLPVYWLITGDPRSLNDGTAEWRNHGIMERRKITPNPKRRNRGTAENHPKS